MPGAKAAGQTRRFFLPGVGQEPHNLPGCAYNLRQTVKKRKFSL